MHRHSSATHTTCPRPRSRPAALLRMVALALLGLGSAVGAAQAESLEALRKELNALRDEVERLKAAQGLVPAGKAEPAPLAASAPERAGVWAVSGFVKLDVTHDRQATAPNDFYTNLPEQPLDGSGAPHGTTRFTAQTSRIALDGHTTLNGQPLTARLETDFYAYGNTALQNRLRLRRAYAEYGGWMIGVNASTFVDVDALPETLDLNGPIGSPSARKGQIRYQWTRPGWPALALSLEDPEAGARLPNLVARLDQAFSGGSFNLRYLAHQKVVTLNGTTHTRRGNGIGLGINYKPNDAHLLSAQYTRVSGDFDYLMGANGYVATDNGILFDRGHGLVSGWTYQPDSRWRGTLAYGVNRSNAPTAFQEASGLWLNNRRLQQAQVNVIYSPLPSVDLGAELSWGRRTAFQGQTGDLQRLQLSGKVTF